MVRKDYEAIAGAIKKHTFRNDKKYMFKIPLMNTLAKYFRAGNPRFDVSKFVEACK